MKDTTTISRQNVTAPSHDAPNILLRLLFPISSSFTEIDTVDNAHKHRLNIVLGGYLSVLWLIPELLKT